MTWIKASERLPEVFGIGIMNLIGWLFPCNETLDEWLDESDEQNTCETGDDYPDPYKIT